MPERTSRYDTFSHADCVPRPPRVAVDMAAVLVGSDGTEQAVRVTEISAAGFRILTDRTPLIGEHVTLRLDGCADRRAQIRWSLGFDAGGEFLQPGVLNESAAANTRCGLPSTR